LATFEVNVHKIEAIHRALDVYMPIVVQLERDQGDDLEHLHLKMAY